MVERVNALPVVSHTFEAGSGYVSILMPWGAAGDGSYPGRFGVRTVSITEGGAAAVAVEAPPVGGGQADIPVGEKGADAPPVVAPPVTNDSATFVYAIGAAVLLAAAVVVVVAKKKAVQ